MTDAPTPSTEVAVLGAPGAEPRGLIVALIVVGDGRLLCPERRARETATAVGTAKVFRFDLSDLQPAMKPADAFAYIAHRKTERVPIDSLEGRITTSLLTPYPPGIPLLIPGERFNRKICDYLRFTRAFNSKFPGFDTDVHGLVEEDDDQGRRRYYVDCVRKDD